MADSRFFRKTDKAYSLAALAAHIGSEASADIAIKDVAPLESARAGALSFVTQKRYLSMLEKSMASAVLIKPEDKAACPKHIATIECADPYAAMAQITQLFYPEAARARPLAGELQEGIPIHPTAKIEEGVEIGIGALIGPNVEIGRGTIIGAYSVIGHGVAIGRNCVIAPHVVIGYALIGDNVIIHSSAVIGKDGFGFAPPNAQNKNFTKIPQIGRVIIQADVEIGSQSCIDRGTFDDTIIGEGTKIDNLVQIAHNSVIGRHCVMAGQVGISGSSILGDYIMMGGQAATGGHVSVGSHTQVAARAGIMADIPEGSKVAGLPARPLAEYYRDMAFVRRLRKKSESS